MQNEAFIDESNNYGNYKKNNAINVKKMIQNSRSFIVFNYKMKKLNPL